MAEDELTIQLTITAAAGAPRVPLTIHKLVTATEIRKKAAEATKIPENKLKLIYRGRLIADGIQEAVSDYKLEEGSVLHCMGKPVEEAVSTGGETAAKSTTSATPAAASAANLFPTVSVNSSTLPVPPTLVASDPLQAALQQLRAQNAPDIYHTAVTTLDKILNNVITKPMEEKYRSMKKQNPAFQRRLGGLPGGDAAIRACGFGVETVNGEETYVMHASAEAWPALQAAKAKVSAAVVAANAANNNTAAAAAVAPPFAGAPAGGIPNFMPPEIGGMGGGMMPPGMDSPQMQQAVAQMMSNPQQLQAMLQDPMVQNMMRNDPRMANNPMLQNALDEIANNPVMATQLSAMMSNPQSMQNLQNMMQNNPAMMQQQMPNMFGNSGANSASSSSQPQQQPNNSNANSNSNGEQGDEEQTEEEMIAEAIRRSLQDSQP